MSGTSFTQKLLRVSYTSPSGSFTLNIADPPNPGGLAVPLRASALLTASGGTQFTLELRMFGMTPDHMNSASTFGRFDIVQSGYTVSLEAGDSASGLSSVFVGTVRSSWEDLQQMPETLFHTVAMEGLFDGLKRIPAKSYTGPTDVATIIGDCAKDMNLQLENNGVSGVMLTDPYLPGSPRQQMECAARAANINLSVQNGEVAIWPAGQTRSDHSISVSAETGMVGAPASTGHGIMVTTLYNPNIRFGSKATVKSETIPKANGDWQVTGVSHILECNVPNGMWFTRFEAPPLGSAITNMLG